MARSSYRLAAFCSLILALPLAIYAAVERVATFAFSLFPALASEPRLALDGPAFEFETTGTTGDPALLNSLRHEAGMRRLT
jgi:hypothetical protein